MSTITVYKDGNYSGTSKTLGIGQYGSGDIGIGNDTMSSIKVDSGLKVTLYKDGGWSGNKMIVVQDTPAFGSAADAISSVVVEQNTSPKPIVYVDGNYKGWSQELGIGTYDSGSLSVGTDKISSVWVPAGYKVTLYQDGGFSGKSMIVTSSTADLGVAADTTSSVVVEALTGSDVIIYADGNYRGWSMQLAVGNYSNISDLGFKNDSVSSVKVPSGYKVTLYQNSNFGGDYVVLTGDTGSLDDFAFNDKTTSLKVEKMTAVTTFGLTELNALIQATAPKRYLHPSEKYQMSSVDWFLQRAQLVSKNGTSQPASNGLPTDGDDDGSDWLQIDAQYYGGDMSTAKAYVHAKKSSDYYVDLQYWFFYPYNGPGTGTVTVVGDTADIDLSPCGTHGGDWERCTFRIEIATKQILAVYMAQHSDGNWYKPSDLTYENGVAVVYSSKNGHATYKDEGKHLSNDVTLSALGVTWFQFGLRNDTDNGNSVNCRTSYEIISADFAGVTEPQWLSYPRRWGPYVEFTSAEIKKDLDDALDPFDFGIYSMDDAVDAIYDALPGEMKDGNGPRGPKFKPSWDGDEDA